MNNAQTQDINDGFMEFLHAYQDNNAFHDHTHGLVPVKVTFANNEEGTRQLVFYSSLFNADSFTYAIEAEKVIETLKELGDDENEETYYLGSPEILNVTFKEGILEKLGPWSLILHKDSRGRVNLCLSLGNAFVERCPHKTLARLFPELLSDEDEKENENEVMQEDLEEERKPVSERKIDHEVLQTVRELIRHKEGLFKQLNEQSSILTDEIIRSSIQRTDEQIILLLSTVQEERQEKNSKIKSDSDL